MFRMLNQAVRAAFAGPSPASAAAPSPRITLGKDRRELDPTHGFRSFGEFAQAVRAANMPGPYLVDDRLAIGAAAPSTFGSEAVGTDGGFAVPVQFARDIYDFSVMEGSLLNFCDVVPIESNSMIFPQDETTPWGTDGARAYWQAEGVAAALTKPKLRATMLRLHKLIAFVPLTDELATDAGALAAWLPRRCGMHIANRTNEAILFGTGNGQPLGAFTSGGPAVTQTKESGQATNTFIVDNLAAMSSRLPEGSDRRAIYLVNNDAWRNLRKTTPSAELGSLLERPDVPKCISTFDGSAIVRSSHSAAFSSIGDALLVDLAWYRVIVKAREPQVDLSMHFYFDADAAAFRCTFRIDGQPSISAAISPAKGSTTLSPFVQLEAR